MTGWEILARAEVEDDLRALGAGDRARILSAIRQRLAVEPERYGKPLGGPLKGLRRIRMGDYRIAYRIEAPRVILWAVLHRKAIYSELERRLRRRAV